MDLNKIGRFIFNLRKSRGLSQNDLADMIPVTRQAVSTWELGKSLPDSQTLKILSEIFEVSIDELLAGERNNSEKVAVDQKRDITLNLVDEYNSKKRTIKRITIIFTTLISTILLIFLGYYFINSYNSIKVYKVYGEDSKFLTENGIIISTKQKIYIRIGELVNKNKHGEIKNVKLYFKDKKNKEKVLYEDNKTDILVTFYYGYNEKFSNNEMNYLIEKLYLEIEYDDEIEVLKLDVKKDFANVITLNNEKKELRENNNPKIDDSITYEKIKSSMEEKGVKVDNSYKIEVEDNNEKIEIELVNDMLFIKITTSEYTENWRYYLNNNSSFSYYKTIDNVDIEKVIVDLTNKEKLSLEEQKLNARLNEYINKYIVLNN